MVQYLCFFLRRQVPRLHPFAPQVFPEREREEFDLQISPCQACAQLSTQKVSVRPGKDHLVALVMDPPHEPLPVFDVLDLVDEHHPRARVQFLEHQHEILEIPDLEPKEALVVKVYIQEIACLLRELPEERRLSASPDPRDHDDV